MSSFRDWRESGNHLPVFMRDFHDQKDLFKAMRHYFSSANEIPVNLIDGHVFVVDWFLWFMAAHGYTLQKTRANCDDFHNLTSTIEDARKKERLQFSNIINQNGGAE